MVMNTMLLIRQVLRGSPNDRCGGDEQRGRNRNLGLRRERSRSTHHRRAFLCQTCGRGQREQTCLPVTPVRCVEAPAQSFQPPPAPAPAPRRGWAVSRRRAGYAVDPRRASGVEMSWIDT